MNRLSVEVGDDDHIAGHRSAAVTLVEYGDYECPYCGAAYPVLKAVQQVMGNDLCFVFRNFPLAQMHPRAVRAAAFAEMAANAGKFWQAHDMLYENQQHLRDDDLRRYGKLLGIEPSIVEQAFGDRLLRKIEDDFRSGLRSGVNGTPSLFINGSRYDGPVDVESLTAVLEQVRGS